MWQIFVIDEFPVWRTRYSRTSRTNFQLIQTKALSCTHIINAFLTWLVELTVSTHRFWELNTFTTEHELRSSAYAYTAHMTAFAIDSATNLPVNIVQFTIPNLIDGFTTSCHDTKTTGVHTYQTGSGATMVRIEPHLLEVKIARSKLALVLTLCVFAANWLLTCLSAYATFVAVKKGNADFFTFFLHGGMALAVLMIGKLSIRTLQFGVLLGIPSIIHPLSQLNDAFQDSVAFFSQIAIMVFCSVILLYTAAKPPSLARRFPVQLPWHGFGKV